ncbi:unnamed protein product, partial [Iphiclides podalirius]
MSSTFEDSVFNFDFNLLQQSPKNVPVESKIEKQRKAILIAKKKTIATDFLIKKYYRKKDVLDQAEKIIIKSQEECKQVCINYNSALEKCTQLEKDTQLLHLQIQELQERLNHSENQCEAIQSHANQLQVLVHELETQIESLKIENQLEKSNTKEQTKRIVSQKNEHDVNIDDFFLLRDIVLGKKKLQNHHKIILKKYDKFRPNTDADDSASDCGIDEIDVFDDSSSSPTPANVLSKNSNDQALKSPSSNKLEKNINNDELRFRSVDVDLDSDSGNEKCSYKPYKDETGWKGDKPHEGNTTRKSHKSYADRTTRKDSGSPKKTEVITYDDLDIFSESSSPKNQTRRTSMSDKVVHPKESILCRMIEKHAKYSVRCNVKKMSDTTINLMCQKLENAHMGIAKSPLVTCLVYLLHFFKCEDKFNRVQEIRDILSRKYFYQVSEWTEIKVLEMFKNAIKELRDIPIEKKMLRSSLIILAKRRGPQWCQKHIIKNMLQPLIENENVSEKVKEFCVSILGPLLKPYPNDMKVHCEIVVNQLLEMLENNVSPRMKEAIFSSLLYMRRHNQTRVTQALLAWNPVNISPELEKLLQDYVREKPAKIWKTTLSKVSLM